MPSRRFANSALAGLVALILAFHSPLAAQSVEEFIGTLTVVWRDAAPAPGRGAAAIAAGEDRIYLLWDERSGSALEVEIGDATLRAAGGIRAIDRRRVRITGVRQEAAAAAAGLPEAMGRLRAIIVQPLSAPAGATPAGAPQYGAKPYITVLCQFPDQPPPLFGKAHYDSLMVGTVYPGLDHYWREVSAGQANLAGSAVVGWYVLPRTMSADFQTTVTVARTGGFTGDVTFALENAPAGMTATVTPTTVTGNTATVTIATTAATAVGVYQVQLRGTSGTTNGVANLTVIVTQ